MKLTIDTDLKTIKVEQPIKLVDFVKEIKKILPDWKEYELSYIDSDVFIPYWPVYPVYPTYPNWEVTDGTAGNIDCDTSTIGSITTGGISTITQKDNVPFTCTKN